MAQSVKRVVGLKNLGNTCYLNSVLQSLASSTSLRSYLENGRTTQGKQPLTEALHETIEELNQQYAQVHAVEPPRSLLRVSPISAMLNTKEQQDAHELMQLIMNMLDDEHAPHVSMGLKSLSTKPTPKPAPIYSFQRPSPFHPFPSQRLPTFVNRAKGDVELVKLNAHQENPFYGLMATTKRCTSCGSESLPHYQKFYGISLSIPESNSAEECTLYKCLDKFSTQIVEDVEWVHQRSADAHSPPSPANSHFPAHPSLVAGYATTEPVTIPPNLPSLPFDSSSFSPPKHITTTTPLTFPKNSPRRFQTVLSSSPPKSGISTFSPSPPKLPIPPTKPIQSVSPPKPTPFSSTPPSTTTITPATPSTPLPPIIATIPSPLPTYVPKSTPITIPSRSTPSNIPSNPIPIPELAKIKRISPRPPHTPPKDTCASGRCNAILNLTIARPPLSLCLHLRRLVVASRTHPTFIKLNTHIQFPIMLDLASYCGLGIDISSGLSTKPELPINKLEYKLNAVIVHSGGAYGGHFTVYRRLDPLPDLTPVWANISDDYLTFVDEQQVLESEAYMLYYEREREQGEEAIDNANLLANINSQITSGLCLGIHHTLSGLQPTTVFPSST